MLKKRTVITFEKLERIFYQVRDCEPVLAVCNQCLSEVCWLTPNQAVAMTHITLRELFRRIEAGSMHFTETPGQVYICPNSNGLTGNGI